MTFNRHWLFRYGFAAAMALLAFFLRVALVSVIGPGTLYIVAYPAIMIVAVSFGLGSGLLSAALSIALIEVSFAEAPGQFGLPVSLLFRSSLLLLTAFYVGRIGDILRAARARAAAEAEAARTAETALRQQVELVDPARAEIIVNEMQRVVRERGGITPTPPEPEKDPLRHVPGFAGVFVAGIGVMVLLGWALGLDALKSVLPGMTTMKVNTALCFVLTGAALLGRERRTLRLVCSLIVCGIAALTLAEYVTGADFGMDQLLAHDPGDPHTIPGRMAQTTALAFLFSALALTLVEAQKRAFLLTQQALALGIALIGMAGVLGYVYGEPRMYSLAATSSMAIPTAAAFLLLGAGLLCARVEAVLSVFTTPGPGSELARRLLPPALLVPAILGFLHISAERTGFFGTESGMGLLVLVMMLSFAAIVWAAARALMRGDAARRHTEAQLRNQAELMDHAREALIVREMGGAIRFWNQGAAALYGWTAADAIGQRTHVLLRTEGRLLNEMDTQLAKTGHWTGEQIHTARDGGRITVESHQTATHAADGSMLILESNRDISERKRAEEELSKNREWLHVTLTSIGDAVIAGDTEARITFMNPVAIALTGWSAEEALGQPLPNVFNIINEQTREPAEAPCLRALNEKCVVALANHTALLAKDGREIPVEDSAAPILDAAGNVTGVVLVFHDVTEKRRALEALHKAHDELEIRVQERTAELQETMSLVQAGRKRFQDVLDQLPAYLILLSPDYRVPFANRFFEERFGKSNGMRCYEYLFQLSEPCENCETFKVMKTNAPHRWEWTGPDGHDYDIYDFPFTDVDGSKLIMEVGLDITERNKAEAELEKYRHHLEELVLDRTAQLKAANTMFQMEIVERKQAEEALRDSRLAAFNLMEDAVEARRALEKSHEDLEQRVQDRTQEVSLINETLLDRIERHEKTLEELNESAARLAEAQRMAHLGSWDWNLSENTVLWSDEAFRILGFAPKSISPSYERYIQCIYPDDRQQVEVNLKEALNRREPYNDTLRVLLPNDDIRHIAVQGELTLDPDGNPRRMAGTIMDITEQVQAREEAKVRHQQLVQADKMVSLGILTSGVAHEINNPNHVIMLNATILSEAWASIRPILERTYREFGDFVVGGVDYVDCRDEYPNMFRHIIEASRRIEGIVTELRNFARFSPEETLSPIEVPPIIESAIVLLSNMIKKSTDYFSVSNDENLPKIFANRQRIEQVLINLIQNACQSLSGRDKRVAVCTSYLPESDTVLVTVSDEGAGIPQENLKHLGDPFFTTKRGLGGTGLGLWVSYNIVREHGATLEFFSQPGEGTRAVLTLPASRQQ